MKRLFVTLSLLLSLGLSTVSVAAQTDPGGTPDPMAGVEDAYRSIEGVESVYDRTFSIDPMALTSTPEDGDAGQIDMSAMMYVISIQGITFDSEENATAYIDDMTSALEEAQGDADAGSMLEDVEISNLDDLDVDGTRIETTVPEVDLAASQIVFSDDNYVFQIVVIQPDMETAGSITDDIANFMIDADTETDEVTFSDDGTSTGGVFDRMPTGDDDVVGELTFVTDTTIFTNEED